MDITQPLLPEADEKIVLRNIAIFDKLLPVIAQIRETSIGDALIIPAALKTENMVRNAACRAASESNTIKYTVQKAYVVTRVS